MSGIFFSKFRMWYFYLQRNFDELKSLRRIPFVQRIPSRVLFFTTYLKPNILDEKKFTFSSFLPVKAKNVVVIPGLHRYTFNSLFLTSNEKKSLQALERSTSAELFLFRKIPFVCLSGFKRTTMNFFLSFARAVGVGTAVFFLLQKFFFSKFSYIFEKSPRYLSRIFTKIKTQIFSNYAVQHEQSFKINHRNLWMFARH
jgi:hypothetical protein